MPSRWSLVVWCVLPLILVPLLFVLGLRGAEAPLFRNQLPREPPMAEQCTWSCHHRGCPHDPVLPSAIAADDGLYGWTIRRLRELGRVLAPSDPRRGYGLANLLVFCLVWPVAMYGLYVKAILQRRRLQQLRRAAR